MNLHSHLYIFFICLCVIPTDLNAQEKGVNSDVHSSGMAERVDHPLETGWLFSTAGQGDYLQPATAWPDDIYDFVNKKQGDFSFVYTIALESPSKIFGFTPGMFNPNWEIKSPYSIGLWLMAEDQETRSPWNIELIDLENNRAVASLEDFETDGNWHSINLPLDRFEQEAGFISGSLTAIQLNVDAESGTKVWMDDLRIISSEDQNKVLGITDKTIEQRMREAGQNHARRVDRAFETLDEDENFHEALLPFFSKLWLDEDLQDVNRELYEIFTSEDEEVIRRYGIHDIWSLSLNPMLIRMYYLFGSNSEVKPGRLNEETEAALLELLWERTKEINDIHLADKSTWWLIGSENHDINSKVAALLTSQIFMNEPEYKDRIYSNPGKGGGVDYWFHQMYGQGDNKGPEGGANWRDGNNYTAVDHYEAWVEFWNEYITERARKGFFLEVASTGYMKHTIGFLQNLYDFSEDEDLLKRMQMFMDLIWAEWAQDQLAGVRGGAKTRWRFHGYDSMWQGAQFYLGGPGNAESWYFQLISNYQWPEIIWRMAVDREGKEEFAYKSRKPGEEQPELWPRPEGLERTMAVDTDSRYLRYSWVTPDYILGTQMDHPAAVHSHLSAAARWQGMSFASSFTTSVSPAGIITDNENKWERERHSYYRSVQYENVLITQQNRRWYQQNPNWYPTYDVYERPFGINFEGDFDCLEERDGWIFVQLGDAYLAVRPLMGEYEYDHESWSQTGNDALFSPIEPDTYDWGPNGEFFKLKDKYSPIVMEAGRRSTYPAMEDFQKHILDKRLELRKTVVPGWYIVYYGGDEKQPQITFNAANNEIPKVNGTYIDYAPGFTFDSPYLHSDYNSGVVTIQVDGVQEVLNFNEP